MAVVDLGKLRFDWKGDFSENVAYEERDVVRYNGDIYIFTRDHEIGGWNPSDADLMLVSADVTEQEGDLIIANASGLQTRLPIGYDFSMERIGNKFLRSYSTIPDPATVTKAVTTTDGVYRLDGEVIPLAGALEAAKRDTYVFDVSDTSCVDHFFRLSTLKNGIHGGNDNTHVSFATGSSTLLQVSSNVDGTNDGGDAVQELRTIYSYVSDSNSTPAYAGTDFPYIIVKGELTQDAGVTATLGVQDVNGVNVLTVNGRPAYQYLFETDHKTSDAIGQVDWVCFDAGGNTTNTSIGTATSWSFNYTSGVTYTGTQGTTGASVTWVIPDNAPDLYVYDDQSTLTAIEGFKIEPFVHPNTAGVEWADNKTIIQVYRNTYTGGAWQTGTSYTTIPGSSNTFTPQRSDSKIRYRLNFAYAWRYTGHAIQSMIMYRNGSSDEACRWSLGGSQKEGRDTFEWTFDSWGAGVPNELNIKTREHNSNGHMVQFHTTYYFNGSNSYQNCRAQLEIVEYIE
jgi:hypothetical protein